MSPTPPSLPEQLAALARESSRDEELLERLAADELTPAERLELERRAANEPELRAAMALYRPIDAARREAIVDAVVGAPARNRRGWLAAGGLIAVAAGLAAILASTQGHAPVGYTLEASGESAIRGTAGPGPVRLSAGSRLRLVARPDSVVAGTVSARVFVKSPEAAPPRFIDLPMQVSADGAVLLEVPAASLGLSPGVSVVGLDVGDVRLETRVEWAP